MSIYVTHWPGDRFDILCERIVIPETCLADRVWNYVWNVEGGRIESTYRLFPFIHRHSAEAIHRAYRQLFKEGRAELSPAGRVIYAVCKEPPGWFEDDSL